MKTLTLGVGSGSENRLTSFTLWVFLDIAVRTPNVYVDPSKCQLGSAIQLVDFVHPKTSLGPLDYSIVQSGTT